MGHCKHFESSLATRAPWLPPAPCMGLCALCRRRQATSESSTSPAASGPAQHALAEPARCPTAPHWAGDGSCSQVSPRSGELRRRWPTYELKENDSET